MIPYASDDTKRAADEAAIPADPSTRQTQEHRKPIRRFLIGVGVLIILTVLAVGVSLGVSLGSRNEASKSTTGTSQPKQDESDGETETKQNTADDGPETSQDTTDEQTSGHSNGETTNASSALGKATKYRVSWHVATDGCASPSSQLNVQCSGGAFLISSSSTVTCNGLERQTIECQNTGADGFVEVMCYGFYAEDLILSASTGDSLTATCNKLLNSVSTASQTTGYYGGTASQGVSISALCASSYQEIAVSCSKGSSLSVEDGVQYCESSDTCQENYTVIPGFAPIGKTKCNVVVPEASLTVRDTPPESCTTSVSLSEPTGASCRFNDECQSNVCYTGSCQEGPFTPNAACEEGQDCQTGTCGLASLTSASSVCCESGESITHNFRKYCTGQPTNMECVSNTMCKSSICVFGTCRSSLLEDNERCEMDQDCRQDKCALGAAESSEKVCCPSGTSVAYDGETFYCTGQPDKTPCEGPEMCASGVCAKSRWEQNAGTMCCVNGKAAQKDKPSWWYDIPGTSVMFCQELEVGEKCSGDGGGGNDLCASSVCVRKPGDSYGLCTESLLPDQQPCESSSDCATGLCGRAGWGADATSICCVNGRAVEIDKPFWWYDIPGTSLLFCQELEAGEKCSGDGGGGNDLCASGLCIRKPGDLYGLCTESLLADQQPCKASTDCTTDLCGRAEWGADATSICCVNGRAVEIDKPFWWYEVPGTTVSVCQNLESGKRCSGDGGGGNELCASGECVRGDSEPFGLCL